ncbi:MAG TPA: Ig-like domain-containing protein [Anaeromyxobacteraceae bacterium]|nr:Ig-like domain-containing protein [Anaeromyxobacteraceae bacterium]
MPLAPWRRRALLAFALALFAACGGSSTQQSGSSSTRSDVAPYVVSTIPVPSTLAPVDVAVLATFNEVLDPSSVDSATFTLLDPAGFALAGTIGCNGNLAVFTPALPLQGGTTYRASISTAARDLAGDAMAQPYTWSFTTEPAADLVPPVVDSTLPANGTVGVPTSTTVQITFSKPVDPSSVNGSTILLDAGSGPVAGAVTLSGAVATFTPAAPLAAAQVYAATATTGVRDLAGNHLQASEHFTFTTH